MQYVVQGSQDQWDKALEGKKLLDDEDDQTGTVTISGIRQKRKVIDEDDVEREAANDTHKPARKSKTSGRESKIKKSKSSKKNRRS